jgi:hypothetical protein
VTPKLTLPVATANSPTVLMFVFWYCHKRGKEARLAREAGAGGDGSAEVAEDEDGELEVEVSDEEAEVEEEGEGSTEQGADDEKAPSQDAEPDSIAKQKDSAEAVVERSEEPQSETPAAEGAHAEKA